ncbi:MAG: hypothetical protein ACTSQE_09160 [Candidatus Heimdallarchaeaceae archaeon]
MKPKPLFGRFRLGFTYCNTDLQRYCLLQLLPSPPISNLFYPS